MNNMQFDEATQTYRGTVEPYRWNAEEQGQAFMGLNKPWQVTPDWIAQSYLDVFASYWQDQPRNEGNWETFTVKPWAYMQPTPNPITQTTDGALQQRIQAMAGFAPAPVASTGSLMVGSYSPMQMLGVDGGS
jgi:hypothetical protein